MSRLKIMNIALRELGQEPIGDPDSTEFNATILQAAMQDGLDFVMEQHPWNECISRARLALAEKEVVFGRQFPYRLPDGGDQAYCLRVLEATDELYGEISWRVEGRYIYTGGGRVPSGQGAGPLLLKYIGRNTVEAEWSPKLMTATGIYLAATTCMQITKDSGLKTKKDQQFADFIKVSRSLDGQEQSEYPVDTDGMVRSRL